MRAKQPFGSLIRNQDGNVLPLAAAGTLVLMAMVGSGVDMSRSYRAHERLQAACDAAVLAGRRTVELNGFDQAAKDRAIEYFNTNFDPDQLGVTGTQFDVVSNDNGNTVEGVASAQVPSMIMQIFGFSQIPISATCSSTMGVGNSDVVMVLDTTGSMASTLGSTTRIDALKTAMKNFYDTVATSASGSSARIRYGFVPYSVTVNVGQILNDLNPAYLASTVAVQSREPIFGSFNKGGSGKSHGKKKKKKGGGGSSYGFIGWNYRQINYDVSAYKNFQPQSYPIGNNGSNVTLNWDGCIEERETVNAPSFSFSSIFGISPSAASDLDIDTPPDPANEATKWKPLLRGAAYFRLTGSGYLTNNATSSNGRAAYTACPKPAKILSTMTKSEFDAYANSLTPSGNTYHDIGLIWGARMISPDGIWSSVVNDPPANGAEVARHVIFMTDGVMQPYYLMHSAYGVEWHDRRVTDNGWSNQAARHESRFNAVCEAVKSKGTRLWVIVFASNVTNSLRNCASPDSIFLADNAGELNKAFQEIAKNVGELRVTQ